MTPLIELDNLLNELEYLSDTLFVLVNHALDVDEKLGRSFMIPAYSLDDRVKKAQEECAKLFDIAKNQREATQESGVAYAPTH